MDKVEAKPLDSIKDRKVRSQIDELCREIRDAQESIRAYEAVKDEAMAKLKPLAKSLRLSRLRGDTWLLMRDTVERSKIVKEKLLSLGVSMKIIEDATETKTTEQVSVRANKEGE